MKSSLLLAFAVVGAVTLNSPFVVLPAQAQEMSEVPIELCGISLGSIYEYPSDGAGENAVGTFPVKRLVSEQRSLHTGRSPYFEPLIENQVFPFRRRDAR